jgi:tetratricopeptide (TPR) repeat protein
VEVTRKEDVLGALSQMATRFRTKVGESLPSIEKHSKPLEEATTTSLDALKAYSTGVQVSFAEGFGAGIPFLEKAIAIDPQFALAYAHLGLWYSAAGESARGFESTRKAYELRDRASDKEKFFITALYHREVTGNLEQSYQTLQEWAQTYPRDPLAYSLMSGFSSQGTGRYEQSIQAARRAIAFDPELTPAYVNIAFGEFYRDRVEDAKAALGRAAERKNETPEIILLSYYIAFEQGDEAGMERAAELARGKPGAEDWMIFSQALALARSGEIRAARTTLRRAVTLAEQEHENERAATYIAGGAVWEALSGNADEARRQASEALDRSRGRDTEFAGAFALALAGDAARSKALAIDLGQRFPEDTSVRFNYLPALRGQIALNEHSSQKAVEILEAAVANESAVTAVDFNTFFGGVYPMYVRGEAYLASQKYADAAAEFEKLLKHKGLLAADPVASRAVLASARAYARAGDKRRAKAAYESFFATWKNADAESPVLRAAQAEYSGLPQTP